jgi:hypothetical protein
MVDRGDCSASQLLADAFEEIATMAEEAIEPRIGEYAPTVRALSFSSIKL